MKKWLIILGVLFIIQIPFNLHYHAYYYATHMEDNNSKYYRFAPLLGNNYLPQSYVPGYEVDHIDLREATNNIVTKKNIFEKGDKFEIDFNSADYYPDRHKDTFYSLSFSDDNRALSDKGQDKLPKVVKKRAYASLNRFNQTLKEHSRRPIINIQWLWNVWYQVWYMN